MSVEDRCREALEAICHEAIEDLREEYPDERMLTIDWQDLAAYETDADTLGIGADQITLEGDRLDEDEEFGLNDVQGIASDVIARPETMRDAFEDALQSYGAEKDHVRPMARAKVEFVNLPEAATFAVGGFSPAEQVNRLITLEGQITKRTEVNPRLHEGEFECVRCGYNMRVPQPAFGKIREPPGGCRECDDGGFMRLDEERSQWVDYQKIRLQQPPEDAKGETEHIDIHLLDDLAGDERVEGGARTTFTGKHEPVYTGEVVYEKTVIGHGFTVEEGGLNDVDLSAFQDVIDELREDPERFERLVASFAPDHEGNWIEKAAIVLQLFAGWRRKSPDGAFHRGDSHIYLLGDPGVGKSNLLEAAYEKAPRGAITDGTGSSAAGLTASITKDSFSDEQFSIEAGTLVRANKGIAVVDELDKGDTSDLDALHSALEKQEVHVSKAGKNATLPARTALLAAGNPTGGHFDPTREIADQVDLQSPLLSRFDLILTMQTEEDEDQIRSIASKVIGARTTAGKLARGEEVDPERLEDVQGDISPEEFSAYLTRAKQCRPIPRDDAVEERMSEWFVETKTSLPERFADGMAGEGEYEGPPLPITVRKLDALQRLAEASARVRLSDTVEMRDVERVIPLIERSLADIGIAPRDNSAFGTVRDDIDAASVGLGD
ncbi:DNA helicase [Haloplanus rubicundus]|uniref:DNA helicase n=1 Tax=Haloplanus rubicundus TaxID=1547898 RepID=A0A345E310_9EURY|nr:minichromosome maintenance protein MCM [Haloplanus rubicundus]AXG06582.1 DNA helicase [Haloplanus rubicundus]